MMVIVLICVRREENEGTRWRWRCRLVSAVYDHDGLSFQLWLRTVSRLLEIVTPRPVLSSDFRLIFSGITVLHWVWIVTSSLFLTGGKHGSGVSVCLGDGWHHSCCSVIVVRHRDDLLYKRSVCLFVRCGLWS
jgi:hypothetical protein